MTHTPGTPRPKTLSIGGATYDVFLKFAEDHKAVKMDAKKLEFALGEKVGVEDVIESCGGGANNTSVGLSRLGCAASFCGVVGADQWGERMLAQLKKENVNTDSATIVEHETSSFSIILTVPGGDRTILYNAGVAEHLHDVTFDKDAMTKADAIYLNHLCETSCMIEDDLLEMIAALKTMHLTWNPGGCQIEAGMAHKDKAALLKVTTLLLLNKEEALKFTGKKTVEEALKALTGAGAKNVCVTDGAKGTYGSDGVNTYLCPTVKDATVVDTTGAGDAFGCAATWALLSGKGLPEALIAGTLNATSVIGSIGAQAGLLTTEEITLAQKRTPLSVTKL